MPKIDIGALTEVSSSTYPEPFRSRVAGRFRKALGDAGGLTQFGVRLTRLTPGTQSSVRHWHASEDEFVYVLEGTLTLITDAGRQSLSAGECAAFPAGVPDAHHLVNESGRDALYLEIGTRASADLVTYPDDDLMVRRSAKDAAYTHKSGAPYEL
ncbi:MAG: cupin domain-containing protein [Alphaproteobacteria bacterium]|nr:cupin domain-containing protein [Alphaproteobacteria bacterium]